MEIKNLKTMNKRDRRRERESRKKEPEKKEPARPKEDVIKEIFSEVFCGNQVICIKGRRKTGKTTFLMEIMAQNLFTYPENQVLFLSTLGNFNVKKLYDICESYIPKDSVEDINDNIKEIMKRIKVIQIQTEVDFHDYIQCLEAMILGLPKLTLVMIDSMSFYHHDSYVYSIAVSKPTLNANMYMSYYINIFKKLVQQYNITILYTLPPNMVVEYAKSVSISEDQVNENSSIPCKMKIINDARVPKFAVSFDDNDFILPEEVQKLKEVSNIRSLASNSSGIKDSDNEPGPSGIRSGFQCLKIRKTSPNIIHNDTEENDKSEGSDKTDVVHSLTVDNEDLSDTSSVQSGEGYKQESETDSNEKINIAHEKISEKTLNTMFKFCIPDLIINLIKNSHESFTMQVMHHQCQREFNINFNVTKNGIEWDYNSCREELI